MVNRVDKRNNVKPKTGDSIMKSRLRDGGPSMTAPGTGDIRRTTQRIRHGERSAQHFADAISGMAGGAPLPPLP